METEEIVSTIRDWALDRFDDNLPIGDSLAIYQEFAEWIEPQGEELEIVTLDEISEEEYEDLSNGVNAILAQLDRATLL